MAFNDFAFDESFGDSRLFCRHTAVLSYLQAYAKHHRLEDSIRLGHRVIEAFPVSDDGQRVWLTPPRPGQLREFVEQCSKAKIAHWRVRVATAGGEEAVQVE